MDARKSIGTPSDSQEFEAAMRLLAARIREAGECLLDLQLAVERLRLANEPAWATAVDQETARCLQRAMQAPDRR